MGTKSFLRPSNIWRLIGLLISFFGLYAKTIIVWDFNNGTQITSNGLYFSAGLLIALVPTLKEIFPYLTNLVMAIRGNKPNQAEVDSEDTLSKDVQK